MTPTGKEVKLRDLIHLNPGIHYCDTPTPHPHPHSRSTETNLVHKSSDPIAKIFSI